MKTTALLLLCFVCTANFCYAQNLVPNPSFEDHTDCPDNGGLIEYALHWTNPLIGGGSSPDYFNVCGIPGWNVPNNGYGYEPAHSGVAYAAIVTARKHHINSTLNNFREYLQVQLPDSLKANADYCISFYVSACDSMHYVSNNIGVYFSTVQISDSQILMTPSNLKYTPQFENDPANDLSSRNGWTEVSGTYKATGGEKFIVIGNFRDSVATVTAYVGWSAIPNLSYAAYYIDDISLFKCETSTHIFKENELSSPTVYPNPTTDRLMFSDKVTCTVYSILGEPLLQMSEAENMLDVSTLPNGTYLLHITYNNKSYYRMQSVVH